MLISPLLAGLVISLVAGCGAGGKLQVARRFPWSRKVEDPAPETTLSFRAPEKPPRDDATAAGPDRGGTAAAGGGESLHSSSLAEVSAAKTDQRIAADTVTLEPEPSASLSTPDSPIQLQGVQGVETASTRKPVPEWHTPEPEPSGVALASAQSEPRVAQSDLDRAIATAERELAAMPLSNDPARQWERRRREVLLRLLYLAADHPEQALTAIPDLNSTDQEFWQQMIWAMTNSLDAQGQHSPGERAAETIAPLNTALRRLREQAELTIRNAAFCEEISYFGNYRRFARDEFVPGQPVLFYAEIENFRSDPSGSGEYRTVLRSRIEFVNAEDQIVWSKNFDAIEDLCRNPRRDYFHNYQFTIPERLRLGPHTLKLTVVDELSGKQATSTVKFVVK